MELKLMNQLRIAAFSPLTFRKAYRKSLLEIAIRDNPQVFVHFVTQFKLKPRQQMDFMSFFLDLAIVNNRIVDTYRPHLNMLLHNFNYTWLWPTSVSLFRSSISPFGVKFVEPSSYY